MIRVKSWWLHSKSERSVLALKIGPFRWVKYSPFFESNLAPLNQSQYVQLARAEMGPTVGWNSLLIELFWLKLCSNGSRKGWIRLCPAELNWHFGAETDLFNFQCRYWRSYHLRFYWVEWTSLVIKDLLYGQKENFSLRGQRGKSLAGVLARVANQNAGFASSYPLADSAIAVTNWTGPVWFSW